MPEVLDFSSHQIIDVLVKGPNGKDYVLREASGDTVAKFNNARARCAQYKDGGLSGVEGLGDLEPMLVSMCLFEDKGDGTPDPQKPVRASILRAWPGPVVKALFDKASEISELDSDKDVASLRKQRDALDKQIKQIEEESAKNAPKSSETGSNLLENEE